MDSETFSRMVEEHAAHNPYTTDILNLINFGIAKGYLKEVERKRAYTFGGVTIALTDTELSTLMKHADNGTIHAIKLLRNEYSKNVSLKQAKDFMDHLRKIIRMSGL